MRRQLSADMSIVPYPIVGLGQETIGWRLSPELNYILAIIYFEDFPR